MYWFAIMNGRKKKGTEQRTGTTQNDRISANEKWRQKKQRIIDEQS